MSDLISFNVNQSIAHEEMLERQLREARNMRHQIEREAKDRACADLLEQYTLPKKIGNERVEPGDHIAVRRLQMSRSFYPVSTHPAVIPLAFGWMSTLGSSGLGTSLVLAQHSDGLICSFYLSRAEEIKPVRYSEAMILPRRFSVSHRLLGSWKPTVSAFDETFGTKGITWRADGVDYEELFASIASDRGMF